MDVVVVVMAWCVNLFLYSTSTTLHLEFQTRSNDDADDVEVEVAAKKANQPREAENDQGTINLLDGWLSDRVANESVMIPLRVIVCVCA